MGPGFLSLVLLAALGCAEDAWPPGITCADPAVDFGTVWEGVELEHIFEFKVGGDTPEVVEAMRADCGCTLAELEVLPPGATAPEPYVESTPIPVGSRLSLEVTYHTKGKRGRAPRTITLYTSRGAVPVSVDANVQPLLTAEPERIDLPVLRDREQARASFVVRSVDGRPFALEHSGHAVPPQVVVTPRPRDPDDAGRSSVWDVDVLLERGMPRGPHAYPIQLESSLVHQDRPDLVVDISPWLGVQVVGAVSCEPPIVDFGVLPTGEVVARTVRVTCHDPDAQLTEPRGVLEPVREEDAALRELTTITGSAVPGENAWEVQVLLEPPGDRLRGTFLGRLVLETGHPDDPRIELPVRGVSLVDAESGRLR